VPGGYNVVQPQTPSDIVVWRSFKVDGDQQLGPNVVKKFTKIYPLSPAQ
jgi:hypothetical protein